MSSPPIRTTYFTALSQGSATPAPDDDVFGVVRYPADWIDDVAETVQMHLINEANKAMQALRDGQPPTECDGAPFTIDWEGMYEEGDDGN